ncbi:serine palmitoyltransferase small subunit A-like isoform X1 [Armigeres subalbatus]|uniref:serine palmitoyltransferase small subunit A-like isoform X1 n=1 Tax=Armigeres subalbatus TaxID=124917 RepID=UPI002ED1FE1F
MLEKDIKLLDYSLNRPKPPENLRQFLRRQWDEFYFQWEIYTMTYMFEPWEKYVVNGVIFSILALLAFSSYVYLPSYTRKLINAFMPTGNELTLDLMDHHQQPIDYGVN